MSNPWNRMMRWTPAALWMTVIFAASSDTASMERSSQIIGPFVQWMFPEISEDTLGNVILMGRKGAHLTEYAILAMLISFALRTPQTVEPQRWPWKSAGLTLLLVVLYAISDEFHQTFVSDRHGSVCDVFLDTLGGAFGLLLLRMLGRHRDGH